MPYDRFVRELLTASGSNFRKPQVNFYRAMLGRDPDEIAAIVALTFMGERTEQWQPSEVQQLAVFFSQIGFKPTGEWKEEIVVFDPRRAQRDPEQKDLTAVLPDGSEVMLPEGSIRELSLPTGSSTIVILGSSIPSSIESGIGYWGAGSLIHPMIFMRAIHLETCCCSTILPPSSSPLSTI